MVLTSKIIDAVKRNPDLWNSSKPRYRNSKTRNKIWANLAAELNMDEETLKKRWKNVKDQYRKELKKLTLEPTADPDDVINWSYFSELSFLKEELLKRPFRIAQDYSNNDDDMKEETAEISFVEYSDNGEDDQLGSDNNSEPTSSKRARTTLFEPLYGPEPTTYEKESNEKLYEMCNKIVNKLQSYLKLHEDRLQMESKDSDINFFKSMLPNVKKLNEYQKLQFQGKVIQSLLECLGQEDTGHGDDIKMNVSKLKKIREDD